MRKGVQLVLKILYSCGKQTYRGRCTWKAEDSVGESILSLLHVGPGNGGSLGLGTSTFPPEPSPWLEDLSTVWCLPSLLHMCSHVTHLYTPPTCMHFFIVFIYSFCVSAHTWCVCAHMRARLHTPGPRTLENDLGELIFSFHQVPFPILGHVARPPSQYMTRSFPPLG